MLITKEVLIKWNGRNKQNFINKGYIFTKIGDEFIVNVNDLTKGSKAKVKVKCDYCGAVIEKSYSVYLKQHHNLFGDCCNKCQPIKNKQVCLERYGVDNGAKTDDSKNKLKKTCLERYGVTNPAKINEVREKISFSSNLNKDIILTKMRKTMMEKYGTFNVMDIKEFREKIQSTMMTKYGVSHPKKSKIILQKEKENNIKKYGYENVAQIPSVKQKIKNTCKEKYGNECYLISNIGRNNIINNNKNIYTSKPQFELYNLLLEFYGNCELNYPCGSCLLDCMITINNQKIDVEYDGWYWHKDRQDQDRKRDEYVKSQGYKILRIVGSKYIPTIELIQDKINLLLNSSKTFEKINLL